MEVVINIVAETGQKQVLKKSSYRRIMNILSLCDYTGNMVKPWAEAGHDCFVVDIQHPAWFTELGAKESYKDQEWGYCVNLDVSDFFPTNDEGARFEAPDTVVLYNEGGYNYTRFTFDEIIEFMGRVGKKVDG